MCVVTTPIMNGPSGVLVLVLVINIKIHSCTSAYQTGAFQVISMGKVYLEGLTTFDAWPFIFLLPSLVFYVASSPGPPPSFFCE